MNEAVCDFCVQVCFPWRRVYQYSMCDSCWGDLLAVVRERIASRIESEAR